MIIKKKKIEKKKEEMCECTNKDNDSDNDISIQEILSFYCLQWKFFHMRFLSYFSPFY